MISIEDVFTHGTPWHYTEGKDNMPEIDEVVWVDKGVYLERFRMRERPLDERLSENEFRYYFENIEGNQILPESGVWWKRS